MVVSVALTGPSTTPGAPQNSPTIVNTAVNAALALLVPLSMLGTGIGQVLGPLISRSGVPSLELGSRLILNAASPAFTDFGTVHIRRDGSGISGGTLANIPHALVVDTTQGALDGSSTWSGLSKITTNTTVSGEAVGFFAQATRAVGSNGHIWALITDAEDQSGLNSQAVGQPTLSQEIDLSTSGADDYVNAAKFGGFGGRHFAHYVASRNSGSANNEVTHGLWFGTDHTYIDSLIGFDIGGAGGAQVRQVLDTRGAIPPTGVTDPVAAVRMSAGHIIDFSGGAALTSVPGRSLTYNSGGTKLQYLNGATEMFSVSDAGLATVGAVRIAPAVVLSGSAFTPLLNVPVNISGTLGGTSELVNIFANSDTANLTTADTFPLLKVTRQFGGTGIGGGRTAGVFQLTQNVVIPSGSADQQYNTLLSFFDATANAGGTSLVAGSTKGSAVAFYPQTNLRAGATNYSSAVNFEADINVTPTIQQLTVGAASIVAADVITLTFTSASISGSPVAVTYTVGAGNLATHIVNGLMAAINANAALAAAGVCGMQNVASASVLDIDWQTQTTVAVTVGSTGAESLTLGSVVTGASTRNRNGGSIARGNLDGQVGVQTDFGFGVTSLSHSPISGAFNMGYLIGGNGVWPVASNGTIFGATEQIIMSVGVVQGPFSPAKAKYGLDLSNVNFTQASGASLRMPGFQVDGAGILSLKNATFTTDTTGLTIDVVGKVGSGNPAIVSGGGGGSGVLQFNYYPGDIVKDANGGQYLVATVNTSTGAVTALTTLVQPSTATASLGTGIATTGGSGAGLTITPTGVANTTLALLPTAGGKLGFNGATPIVKPTGVAVTAAGIHAALTSLGLIAP